MNDFLCELLAVPETIHQGMVSPFRSDSVINKFQVFVDFVLLEFDVFQDSIVEFSIVKELRLDGLEILVNFEVLFSILLVP